MIATIWQLPNEKTRELGFMGLEERSQVVGSDIQLIDYVAIYKVDTNRIVGNIACKTPEAILGRMFYIFNEQHPVGYKGRSISVGDMVQLQGENYNVFWYCDNTGWKVVKVMMFGREV